MNVFYSTDWLASTSVFYNEKTKKVSYNINDVIDWTNFSIDSEGLYFYVLFGYSVLGRTPVKDVFFLPPTSDIQIDQNHNLIVHRREDTVLDALDNGLNFTETDVLDMIESKIQTWESQVSGNIIIPSSGGYDSRLLNCMVKEKERIKAFSYGTAPIQSQSFECVRAKEYTKKLGIDFKQIELSEFHNYINEWYSLYGVSTHLHGMYQIEFYSKIREEGYCQCPLLSGIIGDAWAGNVNIKSIDKSSDICNLSYSHGMAGDPSFLIKKAREELLEEYYEREKYNLKDERYRIISSMRLKIMLLSYLLKVPASMGFKPWSPFLDMDVAISMLKLPVERKKNRIWQDTYFKKWGIDNNSLHSKSSRVNMLDRMAMEKVPLNPLDVSILKEFVKVEYIEWINKYLTAKPFYSKMYYDLFYIPKIKEGVKLLGFRNLEMEAYNAYLVFKPIELLLKKRNSING